MLSVLISLFLGLSSFAIETHLTAFHPEWVVQSRQLIGESDAKRNKALEMLRERFPSADAVLKEIDSDYRPYALDVLVALNFPDSVERLLPHLDRDKDGALTLAVNALLNNENHPQIAERYGQLLTGPLEKLTTPQILAMVDFFTHLKRPCSDAICEALFKHPRLEVQQAAALHLAVTPKADKTAFLKPRLPDLFPQVRAQIMLALYKEEKKEAERICNNDQDPIVQSACGQVEFAPPPKPKPKTKKKPIKKTTKDKKKKKEKK